MVEKTPSPLSQTLTVAVTWPRLIVGVGVVCLTILSGYVYLLSHVLDDLTSRIQSNQQRVDENMKAQGQFEAFVKDEEPRMQTDVNQTVTAAAKLSGEMGALQESMTGLKDQEQHLGQQIASLTGEIYALKSRLPAQKGELSDPLIATMYPPFQGTWRAWQSKAPDRATEKPYNPVGPDTAVRLMTGVKGNNPNFFPPASVAAILSVSGILMEREKQDPILLLRPRSPDQ